MISNHPSLLISTTTRDVVRNAPPGIPYTSSLYALQQNTRQFSSNHFSNESSKRIFKRTRRSANNENKAAIEAPTQVIYNDYGRRKQVKFSKVNGILRNQNFRSEVKVNVFTSTYYKITDGAHFWGLDKP